MEEQKKAPFYKKWWFWLIAVILLIVIFASGETEEEDQLDQADDTEQNQPNDTEETPPTEEDTETTDDEQPVEEDTTDTAEPEANTFGSGTYVVNDEIEPGLYRSSGTINYWARLSGFGGELEEIIANGNPSGVALVEIADTDVGFETQGSGEWTKMDEATYEGELLTEFGDGMYIVGKDIEPGTYKSSGGSEFGGYWARLAGFSGDLDDIIANGNPDGSAIVEIKEGDRGFESSGGLTWSKVE
ncbi:hypothetical protein HNQ94_003577 [Salirhabdus euzebyi]|uniref:Uncharacterized protein n=1 Tax=Salirhabdus euzebyi TaxID=394506 RepID=A0A841QA28_9BACI|nr:hypothetical protein [Salirhabdus euzebyi]MBB6455082.1 hypothetical protein [Salirhabdus euzebyi]